MEQYIKEVLIILFNVGIGAVIGTIIGIVFIVLTIILDELNKLCNRFL